MQPKLKYLVSSLLSCVYTHNLENLGLSAPHLYIFIIVCPWVIYVYHLMGPFQTLDGFLDGHYLVLLLVLENSPYGFYVMNKGYITLQTSYLGS